MTKISADLFYKVFCFRHSSRRLNSPFFAAILLIFFSGSACGKLGPLSIPKRPLPLPVTTVELDQRENMIIVSWTFPKTLQDQTTLLQPVKVTHFEIWHTDKALDKKPFSKLAKRLKRLSGTELPAAQNDRFELSFPFPADRLDSVTHRFAIRYRYDGEVSEFSEVFTHQAILPARPITDLAIREEGRHLLLNWGRPQLNIEGKPLKELVGYHVYTQKKEAKGWGADERISKKPILEEGFELLSSDIEGEYRFRVTALSSDRIESDFSNAVTALVIDDKPPLRPTNLLCLSYDDHIILTWRSSNEQDFDQFRILRRKNGNEPFTLLAEGVKTTFYRDYKVKKGQTYTYVVTTVDKKGNESGESEPAEGTFE